MMLFRNNPCIWEQASLLYNTKYPTTYGLGRGEIQSHSDSYGMDHGTYESLEMTVGAEINQFAVQMSEDERKRQTFYESRLKQLHASGLVKLINIMDLENHLENIEQIICNMGLGKQVDQWDKRGQKYTVLIIAPLAKTRVMNEVCTSLSKFPTISGMAANMIANGTQWPEFFRKLISTHTSWSARTQLVEQELKNVKWETPADSLNVLMSLEKLVRIAKGRSNRMERVMKAHVHGGIVKQMPPQMRTQLLQHLRDELEKRDDQSLELGRIHDLMEWITTEELEWGLRRCFSRAQDQFDIDGTTGYFTKADREQKTRSNSNAWKGNQSGGGYKNNNYQKDNKKEQKDQKDKDDQVNWTSSQTPSSDDKAKVNDKGVLDAKYSDQVKEAWKSKYPYVVRMKGKEGNDPVKCWYDYGANAAALITGAKGSSCLLGYKQVPTGETKTLIDNCKWLQEYSWDPPKKA